MQVGDYVRNKEGNIGKITEISKIDSNTFYVQFYDNMPWKTDIEEAGIINIKSNIIDLIEVGDYVNGEQIIDIRNDDNINNEKLLYYYIPSDYGEDCFRNQDIKSLVTKEQFESIKYEVK